MQDATEVLVVGAGPVGLLAALFLAELGIEVSIVDEAERSTVHSYACALHARTLRLLDRIGLGAEVRRHARAVDTVAFYEGASRRAEVKFGSAQVDGSQLLIIPQSVLEGLFLEKLKRAWGLQVHWNHRLRQLNLEDRRPVASVEQLGQTGKGHIVPSWDWTVEKDYSCRAEFVVGADGQESLVRKQLGIEYDRLGDPQAFAVYEFDSQQDGAAELKVALAGATSNVLWPLSDGRFRWSFQLPPGEVDFPAKERRPFRVYQQRVDQALKARLQQFALERAPWFQEPVGEVTWAVQVRFEPRLVKQYGQGRCWLVGDAAHQAGPIGVHSLNVGLWEARELTSRIARILRENAPADSLLEYDRDCRREWSILLQRDGHLRAAARALPWIKTQAHRLLPCLPASGDELTNLLGQLGLEFVAQARSDQTSRAA